MRLFDYHSDKGCMSLRGYIPALILLAMITVCFIVPWIYGWMMIARRVWG
jgi:hypothetical protein